MFGSFSIGRLFGITVRLHWLFVALVVFVIGFGPWGRLDGALTIGVLSLIVLLHELGHCLAARAFGIQVLDITFWPLGGMTRFSEIPEDPKVEAAVAGAGPAVNLLLFLVALPFTDGGLAQALLGRTDPALGGVARAASVFAAINLTLGVFNLIPAFPMDGGRVLRAILARRGDWLRATEQAVSVGRVFAVGMIGLGIFAPIRDLGLLVLMGIFFLFAGTRELWAVRLKHGQGMLARALGFGRSLEPAAQRASTAPARSESVDPTGARRPEDWAGGQAPKGRWTEAEIERMERYRGRVGRSSQGD